MVIWFDIGEPKVVGIVLLFRIIDEGERERERRGGGVGGG